MAEESETFNVEGEEVNEEIVDDEQAEQPEDSDDEEEDAAAEEEAAAAAAAEEEAARVQAEEEAAATPTAATQTLASSLFGQLVHLLHQSLLAAHTLRNVCAARRDWCKRCTNWPKSEEASV